MNTFSDGLLSKVDRALQRSGPVNTIIDRVAELVLPSAKAKACYVAGMTPCCIGCVSGDTCSGAGGGYALGIKQYAYYSYDGYGCDNKYYVVQCYVGCVDASSCTSCR